MKYYVNIQEYCCICFSCLLWIPIKNYNCRSVTFSAPICYACADSRPCQNLLLTTDLYRKLRCEGYTATSGKYKQNFNVSSEHPSFGHQWPSLESSKYAACAYISDSCFYLQWHRPYWPIYTIRCMWNAGVFNIYNIRIKS